MNILFRFSPHTSNREALPGDITSDFHSCIRTRCPGETNMVGLLKCQRLCTATVAPMIDAPHQTAPVAKRQLDPVQLCIEARCANLRDPVYGTCVLERCILEYDLKTFRKRSFIDTLNKRSFIKTLDKRSFMNTLDNCIKFKCVRFLPSIQSYNACIQANCANEIRR